FGDAAVLLLLLRGVAELALALALALTEAFLRQFLLARSLAYGDGDRHAPAVADQFDRHALARPDVGDKVGKGLVAGHVLAVDLDDDVAGLDAGLCGGLAGLDRLHELALVVRDAERIREILIECL